MAEIWCRGALPHFLSPNSVSISLLIFLTAMREKHIHEIENMEIIAYSGCSNAITEQVRNMPRNIPEQNVSRMRDLISCFIFYHQPSNRGEFSSSGFVVSARVESFFHAGVDCGGGGCSICL